MKEIGTKVYLKEYKKRNQVHRKWEVGTFRGEDSFNKREPTMDI